MGTPNRELQEYSRNIIEYEDHGRYIHIIVLLYSWGSLFGVPIKVPLYGFFITVLGNYSLGIQGLRIESLGVRGNELGFGDSGLRVKVTAFRFRV